MAKAPSTLNDPQYPNKGYQPTEKRATFFKMVSNSSTVLHHGVPKSTINKSLKQYIIYHNFNEGHNRTSGQVMAPKVNSRYNPSIGGLVVCKTSKVFHGKGS